MAEIRIRDIEEKDYARIVGLNEAVVQQTSPMDLQRLRLLDDLSSYRRVAVVDDQVAAFLLAIEDGAPYENDNFNWFSSRYRNFLYVDRIVVGSDYAGLKIGSLLYKDLFEYVHSRGIEYIACEYNIEPPNPASRAFHDKFGFKESGTQWVAGGTKRVSLQIAKV